MSEADLAKLRRLWMDCEPLLRAWEGWSDEDCAAAVSAIKAAVEAQDDALLACWAAWLDQQIAPLRASVRAAEVRIREQAEEDRRRRERKAA